MSNRRVYAHLRAWAQLMHYGPVWTAENVARARREHAPEDALYKRQDGTWLRFSELRSSETRTLIERLLMDDT